MFKNGKYVRHPVRRETKDGRLILSGPAYNTLKLEKWKEQGQRCFYCAKDLDFAFAEAHHTSGRGMHGGKRDDREIVVICHDCHRSFEAGVKIA